MSWRIEERGNARAASLISRLLLAPLVTELKRACLSVLSTDSSAPRVGHAEALLMDTLKGLGWEHSATSPVVMRRRAKSGAAIAIAIYPRDVAPIAALRQEICAGSADVAGVVAAIAAANSFAEAELGDSRLDEISRPRLLPFFMLVPNATG